MPRRISHIKSPHTVKPGASVGGSMEAAWSAYIFVWPWLPVAQWEPTASGKLTQRQRLHRRDMNALVKAAKSCGAQVRATVDAEAGLVVIRASDSDWPEILSNLRPDVDRLGIEVRADEVLTVT